METIKNGSRGEAVKTLQKKLGLTADGIFGPKTEAAVREFQKSKGLTADGIVGPKTWDALGVRNILTRPGGLVIENYFLKPEQYKHDKVYRNDFIVLHHTAGFPDPHAVVKDWNKSAERVATEFIIGGQRCTDGSAEFDGKIVKAFPDGGAGYHIGDCGTAGMTLRAVGIENTCIGHVDANGKAYQRSTVIPSQRCTLAKPFRGYTQFHRYSDAQLESLRKLLLFVAERDNIDLHTGLYQWIKKEGVGAFDFHSEAYYGRVKGVVTHANIRKDKEDMFPQPELMDMILSL